MTRRLFLRDGINHIPIYGLYSAAFLFDVDVPNLTQDHLAIDIEGEEVQTSAKLSVSYHGTVDVYDMRGEEWVNKPDV